ncbi:MAG: glycosyltransferase family 2 protein [Ruminococcaceae bacterium]|nr:glycosyltransferase family 2 protein [Oscillospiraceae bacterium]
MKNPTFSFIMPVYNVEKYLHEAIDSILNQTFEDFELILVDDKSPDSSPKICDDYAEKDTRVKVIHKEKNEGLGYARNTGFSVAKGDFIIFVDSDDYYELNMLQTCWDIISNNKDVDIIVFGINVFYQNKKCETTWTEKLTTISKKYGSTKEIGEAFIELNSSRIFPFAWNKVYRRSLLFESGALFEKTKLIEDFLFNIFVFQQSRLVITLEEALHWYRRPAHQTLVNTYCAEFFDLCKRKYLLEKDFLENMQVLTEENIQFISTSYVKHLISVFVRNQAKKPKSLSKQEQLKEISKILNDDLTKKVLERYKPSSLIMNIIVKIMRKKCIYLCYMLASITNLSQKYFVKVFKFLSKK